MIHPYQYFQIVLQKQLEQFMKMLKHLTQQIIHILNLVFHHQEYGIIIVLITLKVHIQLVGRI